MVLKRSLRALLLGLAAFTFYAPANAEPSRSTAQTAQSQSEGAEFSASQRRHTRAGKKRKAKQIRRHVRLRSAASVRAARRGPVNPFLIDEQGSMPAPIGRENEIVAEARRWLGTNPTGRSSLWCATFMNFVLERTGRVGTGSDTARSFASYGQRVYGPQIGAIAVMTRGKNGGHVGVVSGFDAKGNPIVVSGNYSRTVAEAAIPHSRIIAYVMPM
jgi:uncharacterized protein (TIGR02594 family)